MSPFDLTTQRLSLQLQSLEKARESIQSLPDDVRAQLSADWLARLESLETADPWVVGFVMVRQSDQKPVGQCGFKGPPDSGGVVEIAYAVDPEYQGNGYATEAAEALAHYAMQQNVHVVRAHTLPHSNASTRVLTKCGFSRIGEVIDPEDGPVWRWDKPNLDAS